MSVSVSKPKMADSIEDLVGDAASAIEESIRDEVIESVGGRFSNSKVSKGSFHEPRSTSKEKKGDAK